MILSTRKAYPTVLLCEVMKVSRSGYYAWRKRGTSMREQENTKLVSLVREIHRVSGKTYGTRRIAEDLSARGVPCGRDRARTLMKLAGVSVRQRRKFKATTDSTHTLPVSANLLNRQFSVDESNRVWVSDITYIWTSEGWLYLTVILDLFSRRVVGWSMSSRITRKLVMDALRMAVWRRQPARNLIFHSDRGSQYCSADFRKLLKKYTMLSSMSRKGDCWDNAVSESFFGSLKTERVFHNYYKTRKDALRDIADYIEMFYNSKRRHSFLGYMCPNEFEEQEAFKKSA